MILPTIHHNGTSRDALFEQAANAFDAVTDAIAALQKTYPNGRDYYPQGDGAIVIAMREHASRVQKLTEVASELEQLLSI